jgi:hypothetical protein
MSHNLIEVVSSLQELIDVPPIFGPFDLFLALTKIGIFPVPYFALISCLMKRLTFDGVVRKKKYLDNFIHRRVFSRYFDSILAYSHRRYTSYLAEIFVNIGDFSNAVFFFSCVYAGFPEDQPVGMPVSSAFLRVTSLYRMPIREYDYDRILLDKDYDQAIATVLDFLTKALQSGSGVSDSDLWFSISVLMIVIKFKMEENYKMCSEFRYNYRWMELSCPEILSEKKAENHTLFLRLSLELKGFLQHCLLRRPFFQRKLQKLSDLLYYTCPDISGNDLSLMLQILFESGFSDLSVIALYEFLISLDMDNPDKSVNRFDVLTIENPEILTQFWASSILILRTYGIDKEYERMSESLKFDSYLLHFMLKNLEEDYGEDSRQIDF